MGVLNGAQGSTVRASNNNSKEDEKRVRVNLAPEDLETSSLKIKGAMLGRHRYRSRARSEEEKSTYPPRRKKKGTKNKIALTRVGASRLGHIVALADLRMIRHKKRKKGGYLRRSNKGEGIDLKLKLCHEKEDICHNLTLFWRSTKRRPS